MKRWTKRVSLLMALSVIIWAGVDLLLPDDCESKYNRLRVGMTESEVDSVMARKSFFRRLVTKGQRLRRASGLTSVWTEEWFEGEDELVGVHFRWHEGRLSGKAIWKDGKWNASSE